MATDTKKTARKRSQNHKPEKPRAQLVFDEETAKQADELTKIHMRSFNNLMAWLINQEWERNHESKAA
jgi:hypothetical protein